MITLFIIILFLVGLKYQYGQNINGYPIFWLPTIYAGIIIIPLIFMAFNRDIYFSNTAIEILGFLIICFILGSILGHIYYIFIKSKTKTINRNKINSLQLAKFLKFSIFMNLVNLFLSTYYILSSNGLTITFSNILRANQINSTARYTQISFIPKWVFYTDTFSYLSFAILGTILPFLEKKTRIRFVFIVIIIGFAKSYVVGARAGFLIALCFFIASFFISNNFKLNGKLALFKPKVIIRILIVFVSLFLFFLLVQLGRGGITDLDRIPGIILHLNAWFFGYLPAYMIWYDGFNWDTLTLGQYTFGGIFDQLGIATRKLGVYSDPVRITPTNVSNVFTVYRGMISDFSIYIYPIFFTIGFFATILHINLTKKFSSFNYIIVFVVMVSALWSHAGSIFTYNIIILSIILFYLVLLMSTKKFKYV